MHSEQVPARGEGRAHFLVSSKCLKTGGLLCETTELRPTQSGLSHSRRTFQAGALPAQPRGGAGGAGRKAQQQGLPRGKGRLLRPRAIPPTVPPLLRESWVGEQPGRSPEL